MDKPFLNRINESNASLDSRKDLGNFVNENPNLMPDLLAFATDLSNKNHYKAVWIIEMLAETQIEIVLPFIKQICDAAPNYKHESAIRAISRTILFLTTSKKITLEKEHQEKCIETSLDRLISEAKIASKVYAMYTLAHFAKNEDWIKEELLMIINKDFANQSAGYKAATRAVLLQLSK